MSKQTKKRRRPVQSAKPVGSDREAQKRSRLLPPVVVTLATLAAFAPVLTAGFVNWDDSKNFLENPHYRGLGLSNLGWMFSTFHMGHYQPLSWVTLGLDYIIWGMNPFGYHLTNLLLHAANAAIFYLIALHLYSLPRFAALFNGQLTRPLAAAFAALLFAVHPLRVESVAWVTERRDVLSGFFLLLAVLFYLKAVASDGVAGAYRRALALSLGTYVVSLLCKASGMTMALVLLILDVYPLRRLGISGSKKVWVEKGLYLCCGVLAGAVAFAAQYESAAYRPLQQHDFLSRAVQALYGLIFYPWKTVFPVSLSPLYPLPLRPQEWYLTYFLCALAVLLITAVLFGLRKRYPALLASWLIYAVFLAPTSGVAQSGPQLVADRYSYLSCMSWAMLAGGAWFYGYNLSRGSLPPWSRPRGLAAVFVVVILGCLTWQQTTRWHDSERLWRHAVAVDPSSSFAHNNLGNALGSQGRLKEATLEFRETLRINPKDADVHYNLGNILAKQGRFDEAAARFRHALQIAPRHAETHYDLGNVLARQGKFKEALEHFQAALRFAPRFSPDNARAHFNMGQILAQQGDENAAMAHYRQALAIDPRHEKAHYYLGAALLRQKAWPQAVKELKDALALDPNMAEAHTALAQALLALGEIDQAERHYREARRLVDKRNRSAPSP